MQMETKTSLTPCDRDASRFSSAQWLLGIVVALAILWFGGLGSRHLANPDEGRYAEIPLHMYASGDWVTPRLNGLKYFEKPALQYWATAAVYALCGVSEAGSRLWTALTGFLAVLITWYAGKRIFTAATGLYAGLMLISGLLFILAGLINTLDMGVSCFLTMALMSFIFAQRDDASAPERRIGMRIAWGGIGLAVLSKGLIGLVLPCAVLVSYSLLQRDWRLWTRLHLRSGLAIVAVLTLPWFVLVSRANPEFLHFFFVREHVDRFLTAVHGRFHPWHYYVPILAVGLLPWLGLLPDALGHGWRTIPARRFQPRRFLLAWIVVIYLFFSISNSKLPFYLVPILPAIALLMGDVVARMDGRALYKRLLPAVLLGAMSIGIAFYVEFRDAPVPRASLEHFRGWLIGGTFILAASWGAGAWVVRHGQIWAGIAAMSLGTLAGMQLVMLDVDALAPELSDARMAAQAKPLLTAQMPIYSIGIYRHALPFYLERSVIPVDYQGELAFGIEQAPERAISDLAVFTREWYQAPSALALMKPAMLISLRNQRLPMDVVYEDPWLVLVRKPAVVLQGLPPPQ